MKNKLMTFIKLFALVVSVAYLAKAQSRVEARERLQTVLSR